MITPENWTGSWCAQCGPDVACDEDGCCQTCGADAVGDGAEKALALRADVAQMRFALASLVFSLPRCDECDKPATRAWERGGHRYCDVHGDVVYRREYGSETVPEYPRATALRKALEILRG